LGGSVYRGSTVTYKIEKSTNFLNETHALSLKTISFIYKLLHRPRIDIMIIRDSIFDKSFISIKLSLTKFSAIVGYLYLLFAGVFIALFVLYYSP
jgi:Holliday junction resolvasome RuvABC ATP-dependent DNA helicase subunit